MENPGHWFVVVGAVWHSGSYCNWSTGKRPSPKEVQWCQLVGSAATALKIRICNAWSLVSCMCLGPGSQEVSW